MILGLEASAEDLDDSLRAAKQPPQPIDGQLRGLTKELVHLRHLEVTGRRLLQTLHALGEVALRVEDLASNILDEAHADKVDIREAAQSFHGARRLRALVLLLELVCLLVLWALSSEQAIPQPDRAGEVKLLTHEQHEPAQTVELVGDLRLKDESLPNLFVGCSQNIVEIFDMAAHAVRLIVELAQESVPQRYHNVTECVVKVSFKVALVNAQPKVLQL